jgi:DNA invertase Pin-like site-specific DNA recombinase
LSRRLSLGRARPVLEQALSFVREGDVFVVTKIDRLARSIVNLCEIVARIEKRKASLRILAMSLDTGTPTGKLILNVVGSIAEFEREMMLERQREGIAKAKGEGKYKGRRPTAKAKSADVVRLAGKGMLREMIADNVGISLASVYRILADARRQDVSALS